MAEMTGAELLHTMYEDLYWALEILDELPKDVVGEEICGQIASDIYWYERFGDVLEEKTKDVEVGYEENRTVHT